ncbi:hypothetical protein ACH4SP_36750 [Streptomyces sp. NPDC021093]|uniref:nSTAND1 domain-containing NTPase n=1 Tax=Streptomyces sp. NPDC021093 TaxID=3365112 RepID=UPI0037A94F52
MDPTDGPVAQFAYELRKLRQEAGGPTYRAMAAMTSYSTATLAQAATGERLPSLPVVLAYVVVCGGDPVRWEERWREADALTAEQTMADSDLEQAPYLGLARYEPDDQDRFFGRDDLVRQLASMVCERSLTVLVGPSGSGKSSLLRAGLIPRLRNSPDHEERPSYIRILTPGPHPARTHAALLDPGSEAVRPGGVLIVDQFEEIYTVCTHAADRSRFIELLLAAARSGHGTHVVLAIRADFYGHCAQHRALAEAIKDSALLVPAMNADELRDAVVKPAAGAGLIVERTLTARVVAEVTDEPGGLPLMSHALLETWRRRRGRTLTEAAYDAAGGIHGAIARTADAAFDALAPEQQQVARRLLLRLVTPGQGAQDTRRPTERGELTATHPGQAPSVLEHLARARLITLDENSVELAHEALLHAWPRLRAWIDEDRERLRQQRLLTEAAADWAALGRDAGALYRGMRLSTAEEHFPHSGAQCGLTPPEREFLTVSLAARASAKRSGRARTGALVLLLVLALVAGLTVWQQNREGERRRVEDEARRIAGVAESLRQSDPVTAMRLGLAAWRIADLPQTRSALLGAMAQPEQGAFTDPDTRSDTMRHLSRDGRVLTSIGAGQVVEWDVGAQRRVRTMPGLGARLPEAATMRADSRFLPVFTGKGRQWRVGVRDLVSGREIGPPVSLAAGAEMSSSGRSMVTYEAKRSGANVEQRPVVREMGSGRVLLALPRRTVPAPKTKPYPLASSPLLRQQQHKERRDLASVQDVALTADDRLLALCLPGEQLQLWDVPRQRRISTPWAPAVSRQQCIDEAVQFTPDGRTLALTGQAGVRTWDIASGKAGTTIGHEGTRETRFSDDGRFLATANRSELSLWRLASPFQPVFNYPLKGEAASQLRFDPASGRLHYLGGPEHAWGTTVRTLDIRRALSPDWKAQSAEATAFSPDGSMLAVAYTDGRSIRVRVRDVRQGGDWVELPSQSCRPRPLDDKCPALVAFSADGRFLVHGTDYTSAQVPAWKLSLWDVARRRDSPLTGLPPAERSPVSTVTFTKDGRSLLFMEVPMFGSTYLWDLRRREVIRTWRHTNGQNVALRPGGGRFVTSEGHVRSLPGAGPPTGAGNVGVVSTLDFSPDGAYLATGDSSGRVTLWDGTSHRRLGELTRTGPGATGQIFALAFSPDSRHLAVSSGDGSLRIWDTRSHQPVGVPLLTSGDPATALRFDDDGNTLHSTAPNVPLQSYEIGTEAAARTVCRRTAGGLSHGDWATHIVDIPYRKTCP